MDEFDPGPGPQPKDGELFAGSRPSTMLASGSSFNVGKFLAITAAIAAGGGIAVGSYVLGMRAGQEAKPDPEPEPAPEPSPAAKPDVAPEPEPKPEPQPKLDLGGPPKLDVPDPWFDNPNDAPKDGPEVEVPEWD